MAWAWACNKDGYNNEGGEHKILEIAMSSCLGNRGRMTSTTRAIRILRAVRLLYTTFKFFGFFCREISFEFGNLFDDKVGFKQPMHQYVKWSKKMKVDCIRNRIHYSLHSQSHSNPCSLVLVYHTIVFNMQEKMCCREIFEIFNSHCRFSYIHVIPR